ncbi:hypothetical protein ACHQM5_025699 [Ranunculus cassubicifolius]
MPTVWMSLKKSLHCRSEASEVHDPSRNNHLSSILTKKTSTGRSGCSRSISNLRDVIHGSKRHSDKEPICSPRSIGSSELINPIAHEVILSDSRCELKITGYESGASNGGNSTFVGTLRPGTPGPGGILPVHPYSSPFRSSATPPRKSPSPLSRNKNSRLGAASATFGDPPTLKSPYGPCIVTCPKCGEQFGKWEAAEAHHLSKHAVTELLEGDSSRKIVEIICRTSWVKSENNSARIERVLKVHNMQKTLARFEEYRETVKNKASRLAKKHSRCLADGNELLRFYGTIAVCSLGMNGSSNLCISEKCSVCRIIRHGFSAKKELKDGVGVFTTSTSGKALESVEAVSEENPSVRKALIVCRVIAGRVHKPLENLQELAAAQPGFDSLAGKVGLYSNIEELYLLNPRALLPCFVVICKP